jgi:hypothetical protein
MLNARRRVQKFSRPFGTNRLLIVFPALKRWAILTMSLRDKKDPGHNPGLRGTSYPGDDPLKRPYSEGVESTQPPMDSTPSEQLGTHLAIAER